ncbi:glycerol-3-phosphate dehydrogenase/oxidase [Mesorhizobium sp. L-8-3]|uniref:glycerol-3-phosphate dehydrogenase/oxidase n=1 Tax=Mesorhizobium sp. L-8-3 TaxID=2744522 RepID=UPI0019281898|nr:glycerol-3-phosphate dehydrogenase/oxidase [Mesorhizobium sp. L-8-3]BCH20893.1 glycerol-3-phosphate dehydrogenase [Mesorhizobium sp. L-8-3]
MSQTRARRLEKLRRKPAVAVLVVGGGVNGISTYRELALQGVDVLLVENRDFMSGASAAPSRMIHGGLRYMENGEFGLVKESLLERNRLLRNAPHYVSPLPTLIPLSDHFSGIVPAVKRFFGGKAPPGTRGSLIVKLGLTLYDLYSGRQAGMPRHRFFGRRAMRAEMPDLAPDIACAALYHDARITYAERLGVEMVLDVEQRCPRALALNHLGFDGIEDGKALLSDRLTGERIAIVPEGVVNATGAWIDITNGKISAEAPRFIGGTKGSHLVIDNARLLAALADRMVYFVNHDGRVCIIFAHLGNVLAGSTDISVETPEGVRCEPEEVDYILGSIREVFPGIRIDREEIVFRFAGVRPLPSSTAGVNAEISRDHRCEWLRPEGAVPVLNLVGGKWTTFRAFGAEAADLVLSRLGLGRTVSTEAMPIGGGDGFPRHPSARAEWVRTHASDRGLAEGRVALLLSRYGTRAAGLLARLDAARDQPLVSLPSFSRQEIEWLAEEEHVATLADLVLRRMAIALTGELSLDALHELASIAGAMLQWDADRIEREVASLLEHLESVNSLDAVILARRTNHPEETHVSKQESPHEPPVRQRQVS